MEKEKIQKTFNAISAPMTQYPNDWGLRSYYYVQNGIVNSLIEISFDVKQDFPEISNDLFTLKDHLFYPNSTINPVVAGEVLEALSVLVRHEANSLNSYWNSIHPQIIHISRKLYEDGHFADAAVDAFIEINDRVKQIYKQLSPNADKIPDGQALMNKVFSKDDALLDICDRSVESGEDIHDGTRFMLVGAMAALRNPKAHANITISAEEAMRRLMFASMLMYLIDDAEARKNDGDSNGK